MITDEDREQLSRATELLRTVIARHRAEDLRALTALNSAIQDVRIGTRYLTATTPPGLR